MKKIMLSISTLLMFLLVFSTNVLADSTANGMGFSVDTSQYGICEDYEYSFNYTYTTIDGNTYAIGYSKIKIALYQDQTDDDWALVIYQSTADPKEFQVPLGIFNIYYTVSTYTNTQRIYSDIDDSSIGWGYGAYIIGTNYLMEQPSPRDAPDTNIYTASIEVGNEVKASGSITFEDKELDFDYDHSASDNVFDVYYNYNRVGLFDASYMQALTYNIGTFLVDMSTPNSSTAGVYVNTVSLTTTFSYESITTSGIKTTQLSATAYY